MNQPLPVETKPLPLSFDVIIDAYLHILPNQIDLVLSFLSRMVVFKEPVHGFSSIATDKYGTFYVCEPFWNKHVTDIDTLIFLLYHEMFHHICGDVEMNPPDPEATAQERKLDMLRKTADNIAMDARINAYIIRKYNLSTKFVVDFYTEIVEKSKDCLYSLLKPGSTFDVKNEEASQIKPYYDNYYTKDKLFSHYDLSDIVFNILLNRKNNSENHLKQLLEGLLGNHSDELTEEQIEELAKKGIIIVKEKPDQSKTGDREDIPTVTKGDIIDAIKHELDMESARGAGHSDVLTESILNTRSDITEKLDINIFKKLMFDNIFHNVRTQARVKTAKYTSSPIIPVNLSKQDALLITEGIDVLLWKSRKWEYKTDVKLLPIYLDVSGSTYSYLPDIIKLICNVSDKLDYVWGFSNIVAKHTLDMLKENKINSTGGTDFDCIIKHALENNYKHIVVITDGDGSTAFKYNDIKDNILSVVTILFGYNNKNNFFTKNYGSTHDITEVTIS